MEEQEHLTPDAQAGALAARILAALDAEPPLPTPPLWLAIEHERVEEIRQLVADGADINADWGAGWSPLVHAIDLESDSAWQRHHEPGHESTELAEVLLSLGAVPTEEAFAIARRYQNQKALALLEKHRRHADPDAVPDSVDT